MPRAAEFDNFASHRVLFAITPESWMACRYSARSMEFRMDGRDRLGDGPCASRLVLWDRPLEDEVDDG
jgi:hypothetical protein